MTSLAKNACRCGVPLQYIETRFTTVSPCRKEHRISKITHLASLSSFCTSGLRSSIVAKAPYCQGTLALPDSDFTLFYGTMGNAHRINLSTASAAELQHLADTCAPATFGVAGEDVCDETYRKAGKLDNKDFAIGFDARHSSLVDVIRTELLVESPRKVKCKDLNIELYKLNVYGKDAFFKAHVDTPRSELMFGSLVIVFPTPHEGGALKLRAPGQEEGETMEWTFDPTALLAQQQPSIAYVAFFSDVEHEVMPVTSGHRVTITYNLYYALNETEHSTAPNQIPTNEQAFKDALQTILRGAATGSPRKRRPGSRLKATDGVMLKVLRECALDASLRVLYEARWSQWEREMGYVMADSVLPLPLPHMSEMIEESAVEHFKDEGGELVQDAVVLMARRAARKKAKSEAKAKSKSKSRKPKPNVDENEDTDEDGAGNKDKTGDGKKTDGESDDDDDDDIYDRGAKPVFWVTDPPIVRSGKGFEKTIQTYGNEPALDVVYWRIWIFARVGPAGQRDTVTANV